MKKPLFLLLAFSLLFGCSSSDKVNNKNPYLPNYNFSITINMNLPSYSILKTPGNGIYYPNTAIRGVFVFNTGSGYLAFDAACPNQSLSDCSTMKFKGSNMVICPCDDAEYLLYTGQSSGKEYSMIQYRVEEIDNSLRVSN